MVKMKVVLSLTGLLSSRIIVVATTGLMKIRLRMKNKAVYQSKFGSSLASVLSCLFLEASSDTAAVLAAKLGPASNRSWSVKA